MPECWLKTNKRPLRLAQAMSLLVLLAGGGVAWMGYVYESLLPLLAGVSLLVLGIVGVALLSLASRIPRLAYDDGELLVYLRSLQPIRVPIDVVEVFFLGQGPARPAAVDMPVPKSANVIGRIAESAPQWHARNVRADLGQWCDGYITIRGMWCEPLSHERVNELNRLLHEAHRACRARQEVP